ncbi:MAG: hypothetical protein QGG40_02885, partial [Myxococcota bacterium]|nr:hypothetical protein [Myxococcota bacterium]
MTWLQRHRVPGPWLLMLCLALGCQGKGDDTASKGGVEGPWSVLAEGIEGGVLLSAWSDGDTLRFAGGELGGGPGILVDYTDGEACVEIGATDHALWWIHGPAAGEWYAVGEAGTILHSVDGVRTREDVDTDATLFGVWAEEEVVWAAGGHVGSGENDGEIWKREDGTWEIVLQ